METATNLAENNSPGLNSPPLRSGSPDTGRVARRPRWYESPEISEKYAAFRLLREQGFTIEQAAKTLGYALSTGKTIDANLKAFERKAAESGVSMGFLTEKRINRAAGVVDKLMRGVTFGEIKEIKDSTVLRAAETVLDRSHPKRSESSSGPSISFVTVNLGQYGPSAPDPVPILDISPSKQGDTDEGQGFISDGI
ncbi:hypothetical protein M0Q28_06765 [Patescibacteria group bacterium]|jgi:hypothetical protein|nr:hypothetical protein [Patescibacteria group bacterium]